MATAAPPFDITSFAAAIGVAMSRVVRHPAPGTATEADVIRANDAGRGSLCELIDGVLVEEPMGYQQADFAAELVMILKAFAKRHRLGWVAGADAMHRMLSGRVRLPDVGFLARTSVPGGRRPTTPIADVTPDLAVEVLSPGNTRREMLENRRDFFGSGTRLVWEFDLNRRTVTVYTAPETAAVLTAADGDTLDGGAVLPGFALSLADLFAEYDADA